MLPSCTVEAIHNVRTSPSLLWTAVLVLGLKYLSVSGLVRSIVADTSVLDIRTRSGGSPSSVSFPVNKLHSLQTCPAFGFPRLLLSFGLCLSPSSLPIMFPSLPEGGTKSRVETQIRLTVDLAHASSSSGEPLKYDKVGSWKWLRLPKGTTTKKRTRKEGKVG